MLILRNHNSWRTTHFLKQTSKNKTNKTKYEAESYRKPYEATSFIIQTPMLILCCRHSLSNLSNIILSRVANKYDQMRSH